MSKIVSLMKKEWYTYRLWWILFILSGVIFIWLIPAIMEHFFTGSIQSEEMRGGILFFTVTSLLIIPIIQLHTSLNRDIKIKDIWLHNSSSIFTLIGAKWLFVLLALIVTSLILFSGFFFLDDYITGSWWQIELFIFLLTYIEIVCYIVFSIISLLFFALYIQLKRYIGNFSLVIVFGLAFLFGWLFNKIPEQYTQIPYGKISTDWIYHNLPTFHSSFVDVTYDLNIEFYLVDLMVNLLFFAICYIGACKWIEKVITR